MRKTECLNFFLDEAIEEDSNRSIWNPLDEIPSKKDGDRRSYLMKNNTDL